MSTDKSNWEKAGDVVAFGGAHVVAPIAVGSGGTLLVRYLAKCEQIVHIPWMAGMSGLALATNAGFQVYGRSRSKQLRLQLAEQLRLQLAEQEAQAQAQGQARSR